MHSTMKGDMKKDAQAKKSAKSMAMKDDMKPKGDGAMKDDMKAKGDAGMMKDAKKP